MPAWEQSSKDARPLSKQSFIPTFTLTFPQSFCTFYKFPFGVNMTPILDNWKDLTFHNPLDIISPHALTGLAIALDSGWCHAQQGVKVALTPFPLACFWSEWLINFPSQHNWRAPIEPQYPHPTICYTVTMQDTVETIIICSASHCKVWDYLENPLLAQNLCPKGTCALPHWAVLNSATSLLFAVSFFRAMVRSSSHRHSCPPARDPLRTQWVGGQRHLHYIRAQRAPPSALPDWTMDSHRSVFATRHSSQGRFERKTKVQLATWQ